MVLFEAIPRLSAVAGDTTETLAKAPSEVEGGRFRFGFPTDTLFIARVERGAGTRSLALRINNQQLSDKPQHISL